MGAYVKYMLNPENGYKRSLEIGEYQYSIQLKSPELIAIQEYSKPFDKNKIQVRAKALKQTIWFNLSVEVKNGTTNPTKFGASSLNEYNQRLNYLLTNAANDFEVLSGGNKLELTAYHFQNNYGIVPYDQFTLGYQLKDKQISEDIILIYNDQIFNKQPIRFLFSKDQLNNIPRLSL